VSAATPPSGTPSTAAGTAPAVFLFSSAHYAMWAEDVAREAGTEGKVVPAPPSEGSTCGLALEIPGSSADELEHRFRDEGIEFQRLG
jgi:hypothetical protein